MPKVNKTNLKDKANKNNSKNKVNKNKLKNKVNKSNLTDKAKRKDKTSGNESKSSSQLQTYNKRKFVEILKGTNCNPNKEDRLIEKFKNIDGIAETRGKLKNKVKRVLSMNLILLLLWVETDLFYFILNEKHDFVFFLSFIIRRFNQYFELEHENIFISPWKT